MAAHATSPEVQQGVVRFYSLMPVAPRTFESDVLDGLALPQKAIPPRYFYDEAGSRLFERICEQPEYYVTRTENAILAAHVGEIARFIGPEAQLIELGSGAGMKTRLLLEHVRPLLYVPVDIDGAMLRVASSELARRFPALHINGIVADYAQSLALPEFVGVPIRRKAAFFPGSSIGNFTRLEAEAFLTQVRRLVGAGGVMVVGVDLAKDKAALDAAYDDAAGVTAQFNLNLLARINRELGGDFQLGRWIHRAFYDAAKGWVEMHLESGYAQFARVRGRRFDFRPGETIHTEISAKYEVDEFGELAKRAGFAVTHTWLDASRWFAVFGLSAA